MKLFFTHVSFFAAVIACGRLSDLIIVPPKCTSRKSAWNRDSIAFYVSNDAFLYSTIAVMSVLNLNYAALVVSPAEHFCPSGTAAHLNLELFDWCPTTVPSFLAILVGAPLQLVAFSGLGSNFMFSLTRTSGLMANGIYKYN